MFSYVINFNSATNSPRVLEGINDVQINNGAYHFYNSDDVLCYSVPTEHVYDVELID